MKRFLLVFTALIVFSFAACEKKGDISPELNGKTFVYHNGEYGSMLIRLTYEFEKNGNVYNKKEVGTSTYDTDGCSLYYKLNGTSLTIYHGKKGWKKEVQNTVYETGEYHIDYIMINGDKYIKR